VLPGVEAGDDCSSMRLLVVAGSPPARLAGEYVCEANGAGTRGASNQGEAGHRFSLCVNDDAMRADSHALGHNSVWVRAPVVSIGSEAQGLAQEPDRRAR
jgi:hypothetical protein